MKVTRVRTVVIGSGCAALNAADWLWDLGERDMVLVTEGMKMGTSRNTGSDKQTYYKLALAGEAGDAPELMARTLLSEGVHGDTALAEAAGSAECFFKLVSLGVPFPRNAYGEYVGYQTDHDAHLRASSAGPLTSRYMTEALEGAVRRKGVPILDRTVVFHLLTTPDGGLAGVVCYDAEAGGLHTILCAHAVLATGGPAYLYDASVYPLGHTGMTGMALAAGARATNLHQWQYGLASTDFRWNVSGSYQQVLPRYVSVDAEGVEREFLLDDLTPQEALRLTFLKGYQWPFDVQKIDGSSRIDLLVHRQTRVLGRRVYMDFTRNPAGLAEDFSGLDAEALAYLRQSGATQATPIERLAHMNSPAVDLYRAHGIDLHHVPLAVDVCAQHCNGGLSVDANWQTTVPGLYAAGEAAGTFGAYRPGGSALNATQVGSMRAARHIAASRREAPAEGDAAALLAARPPCMMAGAIDGLREEMQTRMSAVGAFLRDRNGLGALQARAQALLEQAGALNNLPIPKETIARLKLRDMLITLDATTDAMLRAASVYGSTGAGLVLDEKKAGYLPHRDTGENLVIETAWTEDGPASEAVPARPFPERDLWFETVWRRFRDAHGG